MLSGRTLEEVAAGEADQDPAVKPEFQSGDALVVVDVQRDFCAGGALAVPDADAIVPILNRWLEAAERAGVPIFLSRDWHPDQHVSFEARGGPWPEHCVQDSRGAELHPHLGVPASARIVTKGVRFDKDQHSVFDDTGLEAELRRLGVLRIFVGGLAQEVCVHASVIDALRRGFEVCVISDATRAVQAEAGERALAEMRDAGARVGRSG